MSLNELVRSFYNQHKSCNLHDVFVYRSDGIPVFVTNEDNKSTVGALIAGVWQASSELAKNVNVSEKKEFQFNFSDSSNGIYLLSLTDKSQEYIIGTVYKNELNPGKLKVNLRRFSKSISSLLASYEELKSTDNKKYLFTNISDKEIDDMFSTAGI
jgi:predicted regulator of Ras-like GTPase activity (Roadblock/LC7/MglB family)